MGRQGSLKRLRKRLVKLSWQSLALALVALLFLHSIALGIASTPPAASSHYSASGPLRVPEPVSVPGSVTPEPESGSRGVIVEVVVLGVEGDLLDLAYSTVTDTGILGHRLTDTRLNAAIDALYTTGWFVEVRADVGSVLTNRVSGPALHPSEIRYSKI